jgi:hypothetical protein
VLAMRSRPLVVALLALTLSLGVGVVWGSPAYADHQVCNVNPRTHLVTCHVDHDPPPSKGGGGGQGSGGCRTADGLTIPCAGPAGSYWNAAHQCYAKVVSPPPPLSSPYWEGHTTGTVYLCAQDPPVFFWSPQGPPGPPPALLLAERAAAELRPPTLGVSSNAGAGPAATTYVGIPTWLWLQGTWASVTSPPAAVAVESVTATASPRSVSWSMGDGRSTTCSGPGAAYSSADPSNPPCGYTYRIDSARQPQDGTSVNDRYFTVQATVTWSVSWTCTGAACDQGGGVLPDLTIASPPVRWRVFQIETVVTGGH